MKLGLEDRVGIVTGGSRGIGASISVELARQGCHVTIVDLSPVAAAEDVVRSIEELGRKSLVIQSDVSSFTGAEQVIETVEKEFGRLDIVVCNAGINRDGVIWKMTEEQWDSVINVNLKGCFNYCRAVARVFRNQGSGKIVNMASINGLRGKFGLTNYSASKAGIIALTKTVAKELGAFNVNVNAIAPGFVKTPMVANIPEEFVARAIAETAIGRIAEPEDIGYLVAFLCSDYAHHITGEVIKIDGGQYT